MKFVRFVSSDHPGGVCGLVDDGNIKVLRGGLLDPVEQTGEVVREDTITRYLPPVDPANVLAVGRNYREHAAETADELPSAPLLFIMATTAVAAHGDKIVVPSVAWTMRPSWSS
jgi:2-keto-4-pentenoate hydratase/2-oxohepta-3-ene-1,7-dioic acid hydratase in catechol pathway